MESRYPGPRRPTSPTAPSLAGSRWPYTPGESTHGSLGPAGPGRVLLQEFLWQLEQKALRVQEEEYRFCISRGTLRYRHPPAAPSPVALLPASEYRQLERLCGRIPPSHTTAVLSRLHDLLAHNDVPPWELTGVFKQVLRDLLRRQEEGPQRRPSSSSAISSGAVSAAESNNRNHMTENTLHESTGESGKQRDEIPTISSYVDKHLCASCPYPVHREWSLPFYHPYSYEAYSTTL